MYIVFVYPYVTFTSPVPSELTEDLVQMEQEETAASAAAAAAPQQASTPKKADGEGGKTARSRGHKPVSHTAASVE